MKRKLTCLVALGLFLSTLLAPGTAFARDELKNNDPDKYYVMLDLNNQIVTVYEQDEAGAYTKIVRRFLCTTGRTDIDEADPEDTATPTPRGIWKIGGRERFGKFASFSGEYARYWTQIVGSIFLHSVMFGNRTVNSMKRGAYANLGHNVSHGCVRLYVEDAKWLYYYACPGTTIEVTNGIKYDKALKKALKSNLSFSDYNEMQKKIYDEPELPNEKAWITVEGARMRKGSGASFPSVGGLDVGDEVEVLMKGEVWVKVRFGKREGYVKRGYLSYQQDAMDTKEDATLVKTTEWIYTQPDANSERICKVPAQTSVKVLETNDTGWTKIVYRNEEGYLKTARLTTGWGEIML
ncbi:MAG: SH3 domain-containing protein [Clostridia bacterium]